MSTFSLSSASVTTLIEIDSLHTSTVPRRSILISKKLKRTSGQRHMGVDDSASVLSLTQLISAISRIFILLYSPSLLFSIKSPPQSLRLNLSASIPPSQSSLLSLSLLLSSSTPSLSLLTIGLHFQASSTTLYASSSLQI